MSGGRHLLEELRLIGGVQTDRKEDCLRAVRSERRKNRGCILRPWSIVEGEHHFAFAQDIVVPKAEARTAFRLNLDYAGNA